MATVVTTNGNLLAGVPKDNPDCKNSELTEEEAEARCKQANADAEALGIKTRYEVAE